MHRTFRPLVTLVALLALATAGCAPEPEGPQPEVPLTTEEVSVPEIDLTEDVSEEKPASVDLEALGLLAPDAETPPPNDPEEGSVDPPADPPE